MSKDTYYWECEICKKNPTTLHRKFGTPTKILCTECFETDMD